MCVGLVWGFGGCGPTTGHARCVKCVTVVWVRDVVMEGGVEDGEGVGWLSVVLSVYEFWLEVGFGWSDGMGLGTGGKWVAKVTLMVRCGLGGKLLSSRRSTVVVNPKIWFNHTYVETKRNKINKSQSEVVLTKDERSSPALYQILYLCWTWL